MPFGSDIDDDLVNEVKEDYKKAALWLPFSAVEIDSVFSDAELKDLEKFISAMKTAADDNNKKAEAVEKFSKVASKLLTMAKIAI
tara:strand:- start:186 stop:440 length:255 start_codon:yes stop_codon:yes gene_type:complete